MGPYIPPPHAAARSRVCLSWVPVRPPIAAVSIATLCHVPLSGLLTHCWVPFCHRVLADYRPPIGAARPQIGHGPPYRLVTLLLSPQCDLGPCTASHCFHSAMCHFEISS
ncbi:unnamed protein product, partial [Staurois parvus]